LGSEPTPAELQDAVDQVTDMSREP
jgi:hypothetical protein